MNRLRHQPTHREPCIVHKENHCGAHLPYIYIDKILNELRSELLSAMHAAVDREVRAGQKVDVQRLYRAFSRAAVGQCANPVRVSEKCVETNMSRPNKGAGKSNNRDHEI
jgi:hypothetical protein